MKLYLVRHPKTLAPPTLCYGSAEVEVAEDSRQEALRSIRAAIPSTALEGAPIFSSPLSRCRDLAHALAGGREVTVAPDLIELNFGQWEGRTWDQVPGAEVQAWMSDLWDYRPGGGESARMGAQRLRGLLERMAPVPEVILITHGGIIRIARALKAGIQSALLAEVGFGSVHLMNRDDLR
ncbi:MAG: histidine phosphatase family protein [Proteobacteria bacterium]|nr:histidine phosphatase family protein [Pseudomonadota bacterium]